MNDEIREVITKHLPAQVGEVLKQRLILAEQNEQRLKDAQASIESLKAENARLQKNATAAEAISFADVIRALDGPLALAPCASKTAYRPCEACPDVATCPVHPALVAAREAVAAVLEGWTLARAAREAPPFQIS
jgi:hypothetical protein